MTVSLTIDEQLSPEIFNDYDPDKFSGYILSKGHSRVLIYSSNKVNIVGVNSLDQALNVFASLFPYTEITSSKIVNIVATSTIEMALDFNKIVNSHHFSWEPELFPGIIYREGKKAAIFFTSRKVNFVGSRSVDELDKFYEDFNGMLMDFTRN